MAPDLRREILGIPKQIEALPLYERFIVFFRLPPFPATDFVYHFVVVGNNVKLIVHDISVRKMLFDRSVGFLSC